MRATWLGLMLSLTGSLACGGSHSPGSNPATCTPQASGPGSNTPGELEAKLTEEGRTAAGFDGFFGDRTQAIFDEADQLRAEALGDAAAQLGVSLLTFEPVQLGQEDSCSSQSGLSVAHRVYSGLATAMTISTLSTFIPELPKELPAPGQVVSGYRESPNGEDPAFTISFEIKLTAHQSSLTADTTGTLKMVSSKDGTVDERVNVHATIDVCPDEGGQAKGSVVVTVSGTSTPADGGGGSSYISSITDTFAYVLDDEANIKQLDLTAASAFQSSGAESNNISGHGSLDFTGSHVSQLQRFNDSTAGATEAQTHLLDNMFDPGIMAGVVCEEPARHQWRNGTCVEIKTDKEGSELKPGEKVHFTATPRQKLLGQDLTVPVTATLMGSSTVSPYNQPVPGPAGFDYTAGMPGDKGTVTLTSVSNRGIASPKDLVFTASSACSVDPQTGLVAPSCHWTGTVSISATGTSSHPTSMTNDGVTSSSTDDMEASYTLTANLEGGSDGLLHAKDGSISATWKRTQTSQSSGKNSGGCNFTSESSINDTITGSVMLDSSTTFIVFLFPGQSTITFDPPTLMLQGTTHDQGSVTSLSPECMPNPPWDRSSPHTDSVSFSLQATAPFDTNHLSIAGSTTEDGSFISVPVKVTRTWQLDLK